MSSLPKPLGQPWWNGVQIIVPVPGNAVMVGSERCLP